MLVTGALILLTSVGGAVVPTIIALMIGLPGDRMFITVSVLLVAILVIRELRSAHQTPRL
jgi:fucose permease